MEAYCLQIFWAGLIAFALFMYVVLDGYDLGVGILFGMARDDHDRATMLKAIEPFWDGNEVWLILVGAGLFAAFPMVYAIFLPAFYLPVALMLIGLIFRGVSIEFRYHSNQMRWLWDWGFFVGSLIVSFVQGTAIGRMVEGLPVADGQYAGGAFDWLTPFSLLCGLGLVLGYSLLGAAWLILRTDGDIHDWLYCRIRWLLISVLTILAGVSVLILLMNERVMARWFGHVYLFTFPVFTLLASVGLWIGIPKKRDWFPYVMAVGVFIGAYLSLTASFWPYMIPYSVSIADAAAPVQTLSFLFYGAGVVVFPIVLLYTAFIYWKLRGKV
jgi:cytochrome d ubiquinol oxidase subunit II